MCKLVQYYIDIQGRIQGARAPLAPPPHDCKINYVVKLAKPSISIIGRFIHILF